MTYLYYEISLIFYLFRGCYKLLGNGEILQKISHPCGDGNLWLLFDYVHNMKNIYNNWLSKGKFIFPDDAQTLIHSQMPLLPKEAHFKHVEELYKLEETKPIKIAHKLTRTSLAPTNIQKTSTRHCLGMYVRKYKSILDKVI